MKEKFEKPVVEVITFGEDIITTSGQNCGCPWNENGNNNHSGNNHGGHVPFPWFPWWWW